MMGYRLWAGNVIATWDTSGTLHRVKPGGMTLLLNMTNFLPEYDRVRSHLCSRLRTCREPDVFGRLIAVCAPWL